MLGRPEPLRRVERVDETLDLGSRVEFPNGLSESSGEALADYSSALWLHEEPVDFDDDFFAEPVLHEIGREEAGHVGLIFEAKFPYASDSCHNRLMEFSQVFFRLSFRKTPDFDNGHGCNPFCCCCWMFKGR